MSGGVHACLRMVAVGTILFAGTVEAESAGALAVGACASYGYAFDYAEPQAARTAALAKCKGTCKVVATMRRGCAAYAVDGAKACGPYGYGSAPSLGQAQNVALRHCYQFHGRDCMVRAWACDGKG